ncbi:MAG: Do family serine endopeptidase [Campylobacteraceae bacterium]|nr:Do family serine endopeptidase [Campylobacteraceae bacterium]
MKNLTTTKLLLIGSLFATNIFAQSFSFDLATKNPQRIAPNTSNQILSFNNSIKDSLDSVVNISAKRTVSTQAGQLPLQMFKDPLFKKFFGEQFGNQFPKNRVQRSLGSGVIISKDGYIVTNYHVIQNADEITVSLSNSQKEYNAKLIGKDEGSDLAVIKIEEKNLTPIKFGYSDDLRIGDIIFAIGNPFGIGETVTQGIISALNKNKVGINKYENFIQTDASINPGNSGGALVDSRGALIGLNSAIISKSGGNNGIGFAIPVNMLKDVVQKLISDGKVTRGYLGVVIDDLSLSLAKVYSHKKGALVLDVAPDTPASKYGIKRGDLIYAINNKSIKDMKALQHTIAQFKPNSKIKLQIERNNKNIELSIILGNQNVIESISSNKTVLGGLKLSSINDNTIKQYRLSKTVKGALIKSVEPKSRAEKVGFLAGDVIIQIEDIEVTSIKNIKTALNKYKKRHKRVYINRYGQTLLLVIK